MIFLECQVKTPTTLRESDAIAVVQDANNQSEQLVVSREMLVHRSGRAFLPVWGMSQDQSKLVQVELPTEAVSGTSRIWVRADQVFYQKEDVPA